MAYGCELWILKKEDNCIKAFENKCIRQLLCIALTKLLANELVYSMVKTAKKLLNHVKSRTLRYFRHETRQPHDTIENSVLTGLVEGVEICGKPRICWLSNITKCTMCLSGDCLLHFAKDRVRWRLLAHSCSWSSPSDDGALTYLP